MNVTDSTTGRRSLIQSVVAIAAAAGTGLFRSAHAQSSQPDPPRKGPLFSGSRTHGGLVYVAGKGEHGPGDIKVHTDSVLKKLEEELKKSGSSMEKVLKVNVYLNDLKDYAGMNEMFLGRFGPEPGVRTTIAAAGGIPGNSLVEIDCIAYI
jgi:2-iminobutanoate/2-iminopropanoate deaminase